MFEAAARKADPFRRHVARAGVVACTAAAALAVLWAILAVGFPAAPWGGVEAYADSFNSLQLLNTIPALLLAPTLLLVAAAIHQATAREHQLYTLAGLGLTAAYAAVIAGNYFLQLHTVRLNLLAGTLEGVALLSLPNFHSAFFALEAAGYGLQSLAALTWIAAFPGPKRRAAWIRALLALSGALGVWGLILAPFDLPLLVLAGAGLWALVFPAAMVLIALEFRAGGPW